METDGVPLRRLPVPDRSILCKKTTTFHNHFLNQVKNKRDREIQQIRTSKTGLCDGSDKCGGKEPECTDLAILSLEAKNQRLLQAPFGEVRERETVERERDMRDVRGEKVYFL
jgi:hypothetical protein